MNQILFEKFLINSRIDFGAFSIVFNAVDTSNNQIVCLKVETKEGDRQLLHHEYKIAKTLGSNTLFPKVFGYYENKIKSAMAMELLFDNLANIRKKRIGKPSIALLIHISIQVLNAIQILHKQNIIHCDIKPSNIAVRESTKEIVLIDFGLSVFPDEEEKMQTFRQNLKRNPRYLSLSSQRTSNWSYEDDYISFLYTIADFLHGSLPWDGFTTENLVLPVKEKTPIESLLPDELHFLVLEKDDGIEKQIEKLKKKLCSIDYNLEEEFKYLLAPPDAGVKPKNVKLVFEDEAKFNHQHSA